MLAKNYETLSPSGNKKNLHKAALHGTKRSLFEANQPLLGFDSDPSKGGKVKKTKHGWIDTEEQSGGRLDKATKIKFPSV